MLENLRRKSLVKTYIDLDYAVQFDQGFAKYQNETNLSKYTTYHQRYSSQFLAKVSFKEFPALPNPSFVFSEHLSKSKASRFGSNQDVIKFNMILCLNGTFEMGHELFEDLVVHDPDDPIFALEISPPRIAHISHPFLLGETEVTQELYENVIGKNPSQFEKPQKPVDNVLWEDAILFCNALSSLQGLEQCYTKKGFWVCDTLKNGYRLPSEKEWEYAAKAGTENKWAGTDNESELVDYTWGWKNGNRSSQPVKTKKPNEWGFYDMSGNVAEWCYDFVFAKDEPSVDWHIVKGGNFQSENREGYGIDQALYNASRHVQRNEDAQQTTGFRIARTFGV